MGGPWPRSSLEDPYYSSDSPHELTITSSPTDSLPDRSTENFRLAEHLRQPSGDRVALVDSLVQHAVQDHIAPCGREIHIGAQPPGARRAEGELLPTVADFGVDQRQPWTASLAAVPAVLPDDHETAVVREARRRQNRIAHRRTAASFDGVVAQLDDSGHAPDATALHDVTRGSELCGYVTLDV